MSTPHKCPVCDGRGTVAEAPPYSYGASTTGVEQMCHACGGTGIVWEPVLLQQGGVWGEYPVFEPPAWLTGTTITWDPPRNYGVC